MWLLSATDALALAARPPRLRPARMCAADWPVVDGAASVLPDDDSNLLRGIPDRWRRRTADLQAMLALSDADLRKILLRVPDVVDLSFFSNVQPTLLALQQLLGLSDVELKTVLVGHPTLLTYSFEENIRPTCLALEALLGLTRAELRAVIIRWPQGIGYSFEENVRPSLAALRRALDLSAADLKKLVRSQPSVIGLDTEANVLPTISKVRGRFGLSVAEARKVLVANPSLLTLSFDTNLEPRVAMLEQRLELSTAELKALLLRQPSLFTMGYESKLAPSLEWLQSRLGLSDAELRRLVLRSPGLVARNQDDNIEPKLAALQERLAISGAELRLLVLRVPSVLTSNLDATIWPKVDFLQQELSLDGAGAARLLLKAPSLLSGSLDASLRPNLEVWRTQLAREGLDAREVFVRGLRVPSSSRSATSGGRCRGLNAAAPPRDGGVDAQRDEAERREVRRMDREPSRRQGAAAPPQPPRGVPNERRRRRAGGRAAHRRGGGVAGRRGPGGACTIGHGGMRRSLLGARTPGGRRRLALHCVDSPRCDADVLPATFNAELSDAVAARRRPRPLPLIHLWEDQWDERAAIVRSRLLASLGRAARLMGRKCEARRVDAATLQAFLLDHHLWGPTQARFRYGLFERSSDELVAVASFSPRRHMERDGKRYRSHELIRYCSRRGEAVAGGISKLIKAFSNELAPDDVVTSVDADWGDGEGWTTLGFERTRRMPPETFWIGPDGRRCHATGNAANPHRRRLPEPLRRRDDEDDGAHLGRLAAAGYFAVHDAGVHKWMLLVNEPTEAYFEPRQEEREQAPKARRRSKVKVR